MGLSTKQVNSDGLDWGQTSLLQAQSFQLPKPPATTAKRQHQQSQQQQSDPLNCPRCDSTNTKFCYYNNYNKQQPRHFCRACKRHWTKGGTLRNVPVGGGRKNKRLKKSSKTSAAAASGAAKTSAAIDQTDGDHHQIQDQKPTTMSLSQALYQALIGPPSSQNSDNNNNSFFSSSSSSVLTNALPFLHQTRNLCFDPFSASITTTSSSFDTNLSSISTSLQSSNVYNYAAEDQFEPTITSITPQHNWKVPAASGTVADVYSNDWNWEDIETLVSTDLNLPWKDLDTSRH